MIATRIADCAPPSLTYFHRVCARSPANNSVVCGLELVAENTLYTRSAATPKAMASTAPCPLAIPRASASATHALRCGVNDLRRRVRNLRHGLTAERGVRRVRFANLGGGRRVRGSGRRPTHLKAVNRVTQLGVRVAGVPVDEIDEQVQHVLQGQAHG